MKNYAQTRIALSGDYSFDYQAEQTSLRELWSSGDKATGLVLDHSRARRDHPGVNFVGLIGFDTRQQKFVLLKMTDLDQSESAWAEDDRLDTDLSAREQEVLRLVALGASNTQIAQNLVISPNTVKVHLRNIFDKLKVQSRTEAALHAVRQGWVNLVPAA